MKLLVMLAALAVISCEEPINTDAGFLDYFPPDTRHQVTISQGAWGNVWFWEGDFMPMNRGTITPVVRTVYVYELTSFQQVDQVPYKPFFRAIYTALIDSVQSNATGFFQFALAPGQYSFFIREDSLYYANQFDGSGHILPVIVKKDSVTKVQIDITYKSSS